MGMPLGMASLLTAPLVADKMADDSVRKMSVRQLTIGRHGNREWQWQIPEVYLNSRHFMARL